MKQRIITGVLFTLGVALFVVPGFWLAWLPILLFTAVAVLSARELVNALRNRGMKPNRPLAVAGSLLMLIPTLGSLLYPVNLLEASGPGLLARLAGSFAVMAFVLLTVMIFSAIGLIIRRGPEALPDAIATSAVMAYVAFPLACPALLLNNVRGGWLWLLVGLAAPWISDCFAYFTGSLIGRHSIVPDISPKKTLEGCLGGMVGSMLVLPLIFWLFGHTLGGQKHLSFGALAFAVLSGLLLSVASQLGDWLASGIKRWCGVKDFGHLLPGHGGIMDRFDSAFFTLPVTLVLAVLYQIIMI